MDNAISAIFAGDLRGRLETEGDFVFGKIASAQRRGDWVYFVSQWNRVERVPWRSEADGEPGKAARQRERLSSAYGAYTGRCWAILWGLLAAGSEGRAAN